MRVLPYSYTKKIEEMLLYSGSKRTVGSFFRQTVFFSAISGVILGIITGYVIVGIAVGIAVFALFHGLLLLAVDRRAKFVESILPDALQLVAANIKAGFIPSRALLLSARKEFGPLAEGIKTAGKEMFTGKSLNESLRYITKTIKSEMLETTVKLISRGVAAGGQLISLFEETAIDMRRREAIKKEVKANIVIYSIFIVFAATVGAPALYALSAFLVDTISKFGSATEIPQEFAGRVPLLKLGISISSDFVFLFSVLAIIITTVFSGMIIGIISSGKEKAGIKYIPVFMAVAFIVFFASRILIESIFGGIVPA